MISIIICSIDSKRFDNVTKAYQRALAGEKYELIRISDASGMCEGYNRGFQQATGDILIFSHDDIDFLSTDDFADCLKKHLRAVDVIGVAGTDRLCNGGWALSAHPHQFGQVAHVEDGSPPAVTIFGTPSRLVTGIQAMDGVFLACRREVAEKIGWDQETFKRFHMYDLDFTFRAHLAGYRLGVCCDIPLLHASTGNFEDKGWLEDCETFTQKFAGKLAPKFTDLNLVNTTVVAQSREDALKIMRPGHLWTEL